MYLPKLYNPDAHRYRVRYAIANIMRDHVANEGAFKNCFEMEDAEEVTRDILRCGLRSRKLFTALERSHLVNLTGWLLSYPEFSESYYRVGAARGRWIASANLATRHET